MDSLRLSSTPDKVWGGTGWAAFSVLLWVLWSLVEASSPLLPEPFAAHQQHTRCLS